MEVVKDLGDDRSCAKTGAATELTAFDHFIFVHEGGQSGRDDPFHDL